MTRQIAVYGSVIAVLYLGASDAAHAKVLLAVGSLILWPLALHKTLGD